MSVRRAWLDTVTRLYFPTSSFKLLNYLYTWSWPDLPIRWRFLPRIRKPLGDSLSGLWLQSLGDSWIPLRLELWSIWFEGTRGRNQPPLTNSAKRHLRHQSAAAKCFSALRINWPVCRVRSRMVDINKSLCCRDCPFHLPILQRELWVSHLELMCSNLMLNLFARFALGCCQHQLWIFLAFYSNQISSCLHCNILHH